jgi:predicted transcriptional regulator
VRTVRETYHPNAYLSAIRNIKLGLRARTRILVFLENRSADARTISDGAELHYGVVAHHLKLLETEGIVERKSGKKPHVWALTGIGQKRLLGSS